MLWPFEKKRQIILDKYLQQNILKNQICLFFMFLD